MKSFKKKKENKEQTHLFTVCDSICMLISMLITSLAQTTKEAVNLQEYFPA